MSSHHVDGTMSSRHVDVKTTMTSPTKDKDMETSVASTKTSTSSKNYMFDTFCSLLPGSVNGASKINNYFASIKLFTVTFYNIPHSLPPVTSFR